MTRNQKTGSLVAFPRRTEHESEVGAMTLNNNAVVTLTKGFQRLLYLFYNHRTQLVHCPVEGKLFGRIKNSGWRDREVSLIQVGDGQKEGRQGVEGAHSGVTKQHYFWNIPQKEAWDQPIIQLEDVNNKYPDPECNIQCSGKYDFMDREIQSSLSAGPR